MHDGFFGQGNARDLYARDPIFKFIFAGKEALFSRPLSAVYEYDLTPKLVEDGTGIH